VVLSVKSKSVVLAPHTPPRYIRVATGSRLPAPRFDVSEKRREQLQDTLSGSYTLELELGGGGMSRVFVAEELRLRHKVVLKVLSPELGQEINVERFEREIQTVAALQRTNIVPVHTAGETQGLPYYTIPYVKGESLCARLGHGPLPVAEVVVILHDVSKSLAYAHQRGECIATSSPTTCRIALPRVHQTAEERRRQVAAARRRRASAARASDAGRAAAREGPDLRLRALSIFRFPRRPAPPV